MSSAPDLPSARAHVNPRPGIVVALGIANLVFSMIGLASLVLTAFWLLAVAASDLKADVKIQVSSAPNPGTPMIRQFNPITMGMNEPSFVRFCVIEAGTGLITNVLMFATGVGLINLRRWGARWWVRLAWVKMILVVALWGYFVVGVAPALSDNMSKEVTAMIAQQGGNAAARGPSVADLTRIYSIMNLMLAAAAIVTTSIYPLISFWALSRPRVQAALIDRAPAPVQPDPEPNLS